MDQRLNQSVDGAAKEMFSTMLGWAIDSKPAVARPMNGNGAEVSAIISFVGTPSGAVALKCSKDFASRIASQMLDMPIEAGSDDMKDALGELLNMIVGRAKTLYSPGEAFKISVPTLVIGSDYSLKIGAEGNETVSALDFSFEEETTTIEIVLI